ncbi:MAG TPA: hypothetical protein PKD58_11505, partial [Candidatus Sumerlaeota bacterium]|nr:hypothetical protein [Candidatus Sumerlaeota bacterium]
MISIGTVANNTLMTIRDAEFRGDIGRPERKAPEGGWQAWLDQLSAQAAGYRKDYEVCASKPAGDEAITAFCAGGSALLGVDFRTGSAVRR